MPKGSVKIMLSYNYCHFEVCLSSDEDMTLEQVDDMRKDCQRLADKAVNQFQIAERYNRKLMDVMGGIEELRRRVQAIKENYPKSEWTPDQKAMIKKLEDHDFIINHQYDYEDDWEDDY